MWRPRPAKPTARVLETRPAQAVSVPTPQRLFAGFLLQAGVFSSAQRAEELHAKLLLSGVPSSLEARVQVGPFRTRQEAEAAQVRLKQLGIESVLLPPKGAK
jgi:DedD protein